MNNKVFDHRPINQLISIVRNDMRKFDQEGMIDEGTLIKTVMWCNEKLGLPIREVKQVAIPVNEFKAILPDDFEKVYYVAALNCSNTRTTYLKNPFDNSFDEDVIYEACLDRESLGCVDNYRVVINRLGKEVHYNYNEWTQLSINNGSKLCHIDCPNKRRLGKYTVDIKEDHISTPFRTGILYLMYIGMMRDEEGNITFPFHPMITPYYEWTIKEKILQDALFNSDADKSFGDMFKVAQSEKSKAWLDAFNFTTEKEYGYFVNLQRKKELSWYNTYFKPFQ